MKKYFEAEDIQLVFSGRNYFEILEKVIDGSRKTLHLQTYIFETDGTGLRVIEHVKQAAARGVSVSILCDAYGSFSFKKEVIHDLLRLGIKFRFYSPLFSSESVFFGRRLHHKIIVADKTTALIGGINIADKYNFTGGPEAWLDYAVLIKGGVCEYLDILCEAVFRKKRRQKLAGWERNFRPGNTGGQDKLIRFRRNDFIKQKNEVHHSYMESIVRAESSITIVASYFLPGNNFRRLLREAAARGVEIRIILAGISDVSSVRLAQNYLYGFYLSNNIKLYEWQNSVLHGKAMMVDNTWVTIGSYNLNFLSHYISIELNADIIDRAFVSDFSGHINTILRDSCNEVNLEKSRKNLSFFGKLKMKLAYIFHRSIMNVVMMGRIHKKRKR